MEKFAPLNLTCEELIEYTPEWTGDRFDDGRPKVPDTIIERMRNITITQAWGVIRGDGYEHQYEGNWQCTHPGGTLCGRAVTATGGRADGAGLGGVLQHAARLLNSHVQISHLRRQRRVLGREQPVRRRPARPHDPAGRVVAGRRQRVRLRLKRSSPS